MRDSDGVRAADSVVWALTLLVILWALWQGFAGGGGEPPPPPTLDSCVSRGVVSTPEGQVFCILVTDRRGNGKEG